MTVVAHRRSKEIMNAYSTDAYSVEIHHNTNILDAVSVIVCDRGRPLGAGHLCTITSNGIILSSHIDSTLGLNLDANGAMILSRNLDPFPARTNIKFGAGESMQAVPWARVPGDLGVPVYVRAEQIKEGIGLCLCDARRNQLPGGSLAVIQAVGNFRARKNINRSLFTGPIDVDRSGCMLVRGEDEF
jgi:hypothetical protein